MPTYTLSAPDPETGQSVVLRVNDDGSTAFIPPDPANRDYQEYLAWADLQANPPQPAPPPEPDPSTVVMNDLVAKSKAALQGNRDFLDLAAPTNAQTLAQVKALTRQMNGVIRLAVGDLSGTD